MTQDISDSTSLGSGFASGFNWQLGAIRQAGNSHVVEQGSDIFGGTRLAKPSGRKQGRRSMLLRKQQDRASGAIPKTSILSSMHLCRFSGTAVLVPTIALKSQ